ncbi:MAG: DMT family transporter [Oscillospiraceae bacterium]|nr:DMT family transporter [Oscillospiraceae bacterium]
MKTDSNKVNKYCLLVVLQTIVYGFGDPISKIVYTNIPVYSAMSIRYVIALAVLFIFFGKRIVQGLKAVSPKVWIIPSLCISGSYILGNLGLQLASATSVSFLRSLPIVFTPVLGLIFFRRRYNWRIIPVQAAIVVGLYLLCGKGGLTGFGLGEVFALLAALLMAGGLISSGEAMKKMDAVVLSAAQTIVIGIICAICAPLLGGGWHLKEFTPKFFAITAYLAIVCTVIGYMLQNKALGKISARTVALLQCLNPVMTSFFSFIILKETLSPAGFVGAAIILVCVALATFMEKKE